MVGRTISHYKILFELGRGGMGVVHKVEDTKLERIVAVFHCPSPRRSATRYRRGAHDPFGRGAPAAIQARIIKET